MNNYIYNLYLFIYLFMSMWKLHGLVLAPRLQKGYQRICEANLKALGANVLAFISKLGPPNNKPKMLKVGLQLFS